MIRNLLCVAALSLTGPGCCLPGISLEGRQCPCSAGFACDTANNLCVPLGDAGDAGGACLLDLDCDDGLVCNGAEVCGGGFCRSGAPPNCDDAVACTADACHESLGGCSSLPDHQACGAAELCTTAGCAMRACTVDAECNDGLACNGQERCAAGACAPASAVCDDGDPCTIDGCDPAVGCTHTPRDLDGDGYGDARCGGTDCDDGSMLVHPGATEECNALDDDCNGRPDDSFACTLGARSPCVTACMSSGSRLCAAGCNWGACQPPAEICNGLDDDCDLVADNGFACAAGEIVDCATPCGSTGRLACAADCLPGACVAPSEVCNGVDDDCNGRIDENCNCPIAGATEPCTTSCGSAGAHVCGLDLRWGPCVPPPETCNGLDDDCDLLIDEDFPCVLGTSRFCTTSCAGTGTQMCAPGCVLGACAPPAETCNGLDDDCDGQCDNGWSCCAGGTVDCTTACGIAGVQACDATCSSVGACCAFAEACGNGCDDDCDGAIDEGCGGGTVTVPAGDFWMGCAATDTLCDPDESPYHLVSVSAFEIDRTEVTQAAYEVCRAAGACTVPTCDWDPVGRANYPVVCVTWDQARAYCAWAGMRLPTEAEWEKAGRGADGRVFPWGNAAADCTLAAMFGCGAIQPVGSRPAGVSPYGALDMSGNAWEWVADWYLSTYYASGPAVDPMGPASGTTRIRRGGSYQSGQDLLRVSNRYTGSLTLTANNLGVRCAR